MWGFAVLFSEAFLVDVIAHDQLTAVAAGYNVIDRTGVLKAFGPQFRLRLTRTAEVDNVKMLHKEQYLSSGKANCFLCRCSSDAPRNGSVDFDAVFCRNSGVCF